MVIIAMDPQKRAGAKKHESQATRTARLLLEHDKWERELQEHVATRLSKVEEALVQINHFTEYVESLDLPAWKAEVTTNIVWLKLLMGGTTVAAIGQLVLSLFKAN